MTSIPRIVLGSWRLLKRWVDSHEPIEGDATRDHHVIDWVRTIPFMMLHAATLAVFWVGWSPVALMTAIMLYGIRMFAITGFYHRYFSHRTFRTSRAIQFAFALMGASAVQRGPLWWAANHRVHHAYSDRLEDIHSPVHHGLWWSHMGWFLSRGQLPTKHKFIKDFSRYPELRFLDRFDIFVPLLLAVSLFFGGDWLERAYPSLETNGWQMLIWGFVISTIFLYHGTFTINSLAHRLGSRRYATPDNSRNNFFLAVITMGEGWHNNHHRYSSSARQGFHWWEIDMTYYLLRILQWGGVIWDIRPVPTWVLRQPYPALGTTVPDSEKVAV